jgi:hypothetical protein
MSAHMGFKNGIREGLWWVPVVAALAVLPFFWRGTSNGHDLPFHVNTWIEAVLHWKAGILYPHWAAFANHGSGEPRFVFYPPVSWTAGALLGLILPWQAVPGTLSALVCVAAGVSMFLFAREWLDDRTAVMAAILYAVDPYLLVVIYERCAYGEMVAAIWLPGILLFALRERGGFARNTLLLGLHVAAIWLTNLPSAVIASYLLAIIVIARAVQLRRLEPMLRAAAAMALGLGLAGFYLVPAVYEQRWIQIGQAVSPGASPRYNFLFAHTDDAEHDVVLLHTSIFAMLEFVAVALFAWIARPLRQRSASLFSILLGTATFAAFMMTPPSLVFWTHAPKLLFVQFPWRWLLVVNLSLTFLAAVSFARIRASRLALVAVVPLVIGVCYWQFQQRIYPEDRPAAQAEAIASGEGYDGTDEYLPTAADNSQLEPYAPRIAIQIASEDEDQRKIAPSSLVHSTFQVWDVEKKRFTVDAQVPTRNTLRLLDYPAWNVEVDGKAYPRAADETTGRMVLELPAGHHEVAIDYTRTPDRTWGQVLSAIAFLAAIGLWITGRNSQLTTETLKHRAFL